MCGCGCQLSLCELFVCCAWEGGKERLSQDVGILSAMPYRYLQNTATYAYCGGIYIYVVNFVFQTT